MRNVQLLLEPEAEGDGGKRNLDRKVGDRVSMLREFDDVHQGSGADVDIEVPGDVDQDPPCGHSRHRVRAS